MVANKHELIANAAMAQLHKMWPCTFDIEIPEAPAGWSWTMAQNDGEFAPRPAEVKASILQRNTVPKSAPVGRQVSLRACEMQAEALVYVRDREVTYEAVQAELQPLLAQLHREGVTITGRMA